MGEGVKIWGGVGVSEGAGVALTVGVVDAVAVAESVAETEGDWLGVAGGRVVSSFTWANWERRVAGCRMAQAAKKRVRKRRLPAPTIRVGVVGKSLFVMTFFADGRSRFGQIGEEEGAIFAGADGVVAHGGRKEGEGDSAKIYLVAAAI